ncbi:BlaI/MecI/CopY family transcriptional regulator [Persicirhabdus sediminis]|uniref:BlaI/MecI/CopY family transcriptional regulator n=1 Tax=Persicirhabdus sediminis TaxID=454144 RepID=A0A8J7ME06_9BACT|nr:BlaI/MecI/CopY family transcriptional regulator [Persicirhabdus sediminis]MBK1790940.1 BlaI/MecI/CopY family transcriptional regulator [Persicirhabdus sediminis]
MSDGKISESEWKVMEVLWASSPLSAQQIVSAVSKEEAWKPQTVKTMLGRLVKKGVLSYKTEGNRYFYSPLIEKEQATQQETSSFLGRICRNSLMPLLAHSLQTNRKLDEDEIKALRELLAKQEEK